MKCKLPSYDRKPDPLLQYLRGTEDMIIKTSELTHHDMLGTVRPTLAKWKALGFGYKRVVEQGYTCYLPQYPVLAPPRYFKGPNAVVTIAGRRYKVDYESHMNDSDVAELSIEPTNLPETAGLKKGQTGTGAFSAFPTCYFGQPTFVQNPFLIRYDNRPVYPLFTWESGWGDCGNENVFIQLDQNNVPARAWLEASCA